MLWRRRRLDHLKTIPARKARARRREKVLKKGRRSKKRKRARKVSSNLLKLRICQTILR